MGTPPPVYGRVVTILSIDGGGVRGIVPAVLLKYLERRLQKKNENASIAEYFDVIAGTSTGGLIAAMLAAPDPENPSRPLFTTQDIIKFYKTHCPKIFPYAKYQNQWDEFITNFRNPKYDGKYLHEVINTNLKETRLHQTLTKVVMPTYDIKKVQPTIFSSFKVETTPTMDAKLADICIGTSAAPTYLPPYYFVNKTSNNADDDAEFNLVDGGLVATNPALVTISEVTQQSQKDPEHLFPIKPNEYTKFYLVSLGTGSSKDASRYSAQDADSWGRIHWALGPLEEFYGNSSADMTDYYLSTVFQGLNAEHNYLRIQDDTLDKDMSPMDLATEENLKKLEIFAENLLQKQVTRMNIQTFTLEPISEKITYAEALDRVADFLLEEKEQRRGKMLPSK